MLVQAIDFKVNCVRQVGCAASVGIGDMAIKRKGTLL